MRNFFLLLIAFMYLSACNDHSRKNEVHIISIAKGQMPALTSDNTNSIQMVFGNGDSIMYSSLGKKNNSFSSPVVIDTLPNLVAYATRGPQITTTKNGLVVIAVNKAGNIYSYLKEANENWVRSAQVNDVDTTDKEGFLGLSSDGENNLFAIWTDLRNDKHNKIFGARSSDGGKTWSQNILVYASPDGNICECCKPSVVMNGNKVVVMFRNWLNGDRDLYVTGSSDGGRSFGVATKLGEGSWALDGCPMDGGGLAMNKDGTVETVWRRKSAIYACEPGKQETELGAGKNCVLQTINGKIIYAWSNNGNIICLLPGGISKTVGQGSLPVLRSINDDEAICVWENNNQIEGYILKL